MVHVYVRLSARSRSVDDPVRDGGIGHGAGAVRCSLPHAAGHRRPVGADGPTRTPLHADPGRRFAHGSETAAPSLPGTRRRALSARLRTLPRPHHGERVARFQPIIPSTTRRPAVDGVDTLVGT